MIPLLAATLTSALLTGFIPTLIDGLQKLWQPRLNQSPDRLEWPVRLFYFAWLPAMPATGFLLDEWPGFFNEILFFGLVGLIMGLAWLALVRTLAGLMGNMLLLGCAYSVVTIAAIRLMTLALFPDWPDLTFASLNLGFIAVGFGAMLGPIIVSAIESWWGYRQGLLYISFACVIPAALATISKPPALPKLLHETDVLHTIGAHPYLALIIAILLIYFAIENCLEFWPEPYLKELGHEEGGLRRTLFLFWIAFLATRGVAAWWFYNHPSHGEVLTVSLAVLSAVVIGNLAGGYEVGSGSFGFWVAGACYGPLLPSLLGITFLVLPEFPTTGLGVLLALSGLDTLIVRPVMRGFTAGRPARLVMRVPTVLALLLAAPLILLVLMRQ